MNHNSNIQEQTQFPAANGLFDLAATSSQHLFPIGVHIMLMLSLSCNECCSAAGMSDIADVSWQSARDAVTLSRCHAVTLSRNVFVLQTYIY